MKLSFKVFFSALVSVLVVGAPVVGAHAQLPQIPAPPPPPAQAQPAIDVVAPLTYQACLAQSNVDTVVGVAGAVAPIPIDLSTAVISPVRNLLLLDVVCGYFVSSIVPPVCSVDNDTIGGVPAVGAALTLPQPASILGTEAAAIDRALRKNGVPIANGQIRNPVWSQLGCRR